MATHTAPTRRGFRWWSWWLLAHAAIIAAVLVVYGLTTSSTTRPPLPEAVLTLTSVLSLLLSTPWWLVVGGLWFIPLDDSDTVLLAVLGWLTQALPLLINLALHVIVLNLVRRRRATVASTATGTASATGTSSSGAALRLTASSGSPAGPPGTGPAEPASGGPRGLLHRSRGRVLLLSAVAGALVWLSWLGWDRTASFDTVTGTMQYPYVTLQVLGCAACVGALVAGLAVAGRPLEGAGGVTLGFWVVWTTDAVTQDDSGLAGVGAIMLLFGLALGTAIAASLGWGLRLLVGSARSRRGAPGTAL